MLVEDTPDFELNPNWLRLLTVRDAAMANEQGISPTGLPDDNRALEPPDPIPNSEVKRRIADGSVAFAM